MNSREVRVEAADAILAGELVLPAGGGPFASAVLLHGTGWGERGFYRAHAEVFAEAGVASLIFDRRGNGQSTGDTTMDIATLARDAAAVMAFARAQPEVDPRVTGFWGYSNGAWVAARAAADDPDLAFLVLTGAAGVTPGEAEVYRRTEDVRRRGAPPASVANVWRTWTILFDAMGSGRWEPGWDVELAALSVAIRDDEALKSLPVADFVKQNPQLDSVPRFESPMLADPRTLAGTMPDMGYDPIPALASLSCPILAVLAEDDLSVPVARSLEHFEVVAARRVGHAGAGFDIHVLPGAGHTFARPGASSVEDGPFGPMARDEFMPGYLELMATWMAQRREAVAPPSPPH